MQNPGFLFLALVVLNCMSSLLAAPARLQPSTKGIQNVLDKLELFVKKHQTSSGLTVAEFKKAAEEYEQLEEDRRDQLKLRRPLFHLLSDFLLHPMAMSPELVDLFDERDYVERLERHYKQFRPLYLGDMIGRSYVKADSIDALILSLLQLPGHKPLTQKLLTDAMNQLKSFRARIEEIGTIEDIYSCLKDLKNVFNLLNRDMVKVLEDTILPLAEKTNYNLAALRELYLKELKEKYSIIVRNGELIKIIS